MRNLAKKIELDSIHGSLQHLADPEEVGPLIKYRNFGKSVELETLRGSLQHLLDPEEVVPTSHMGITVLFDIR